MRKLLLFTALYFINSVSTNACGYYPYGEDVRFSMLTPNLVFPNSTNHFFYSARGYSFPASSEETFDSGKFEENLNLWRELLDNKASKDEIYFAIYEASEQELKNRRSDNQAIKQLNLKENKEVLNYLRFAKSISELNSFRADPWEKEGANKNELRNKMIARCVMNSHKTQSEKLKKRYGHLAIRLAYYNLDQEKVDQLYSMYFDRNELVDALDFWALHFQMTSMKPGIEKNINAALICANSPEKRLQASKRISHEFSLKQCLTSAKTDLERSSLYYAYTIRSSEYSLSSIKAFAAYKGNEEMLLFLTLREINKLEDWILTPYYTSFEPSTKTTWSDTITGYLLRKRLVKDRIYANELSVWLKELLKKNPTFKEEWWLGLQLHTDFLAGNRKELIKSIEALPKSELQNQELLSFIDRLSILTQIANSSDLSIRELGLEKEIYTHKDRNQFLFTVGRELEFAGAKTDAAYILSKVNRTNDYRSSVQWKTLNRSHSIGSDYYYNYFFYMDAAYQLEEVSEVIDYLVSDLERSEFDEWKTETMRPDLERLYEMLGGKYLRTDQLEKALSAFNKINPEFWKAEKFKDYLSSDPFDNNFMTNDYSSSNTSYTKPEIVEKLIKLKAKVATTSGDEKAKNAFLVANCYRNMTYHGNAWLMKRYWWSGNYYDKGFEDDDDYIQANLAKKYYMLAKSAAKTPKFAALSLRLAGKCESYKVMDEAGSHWRYDDYDEYVFSHNKTYVQLKNEFPDDYEPLMSNCNNLYRYFDDLK